MKATWFGVCSALGLALIATGAPRGAAQGPAEAKKAQTAEDDTKGVRDLVAAFVKAYNARDAKAIAAQFAEDGRVVAPDGSITEGREAIEKRFRETFDDVPDAKIEVTSEKIRLLTPDVAQEEGRATIRSGDGPRKGGRYHALYVRRDGKWLQSSIYDFADEPATDAPSERLKDLDWLQGEWIDEGDGSVAHTTCKRDASGAFLVREFDLKIGGREALSGTQRIGWDPSAGQFRSWVFDSEGGFSEGRWSRSGDRWVVKNVGYVPDGRVVSATNIIHREGKDRVRWSTTDRTLGGEALDEDAEVILVRKPPKPM